MLTSDQNPVLICSNDCSLQVWVNVCHFVPTEALVTNATDPLTDGRRVWAEEIAAALLVPPRGPDGAAGVVATDKGQLLAELPELLHLDASGQAVDPAAADVA